MSVDMIDTLIFVFLRLFCQFSVSFGEQVTCPEPFGLFDHPKDCSLFINCWESRPYVQNCPRDLFFNSRTGKCDYQENVECFDDDSDGWKRACGQDGPFVVTPSTRIVKSRSINGVYSPNLNCTWSIHAPESQLIEMTFDELDVENSKSCLNDRIDVYDGEFSNESKIRTLCGKDQSLRVRSNTNRIYVHFLTDLHNEFEGFRFRFEFIKPEKVITNSVDFRSCNTEIKELSGKKGILTSPNFDFDDESSTYPPNSRYKWRIVAPPNHFINLHFLFMDIEKSHSCGLDALVLYGDCHMDNVLDAFCGNKLPKDFNTNSNELVLLFASDLHRSFRGFALEYQILPESNRCKSDEMMCPDKTCVQNKYRCNGFNNCRNQTDEIYCAIPRTTFRECGIPAVQPLPGNARIIGGRVAKPGSWPWQAALSTVHYDGFDFQCGAIVIHPEWLLTAAHCFKYISRADRWALEVGKHNFSVEEDSVQIRSIDKIVPHPKYGDESSKFRGEYDIALVHVRRPLEFTDYVIPVCLPEAFEEVEVDMRVYVTGYGRTDDILTGGLLNQVELPIIDQKICNQLHNNKLTDSMFCAGLMQGGHDSCQGDSGGPAVTLINDRWKLLGVVSWGDQCAQENKPGVYTKVSHFIPWIKNIIGNKFV